MATFQSNIIHKITLQDTSTLKAILAHYEAYLNPVCWIQYDDVGTQYIHLIIVKAVKNDDLIMSFFDWPGLAAKRVCAIVLEDLSRFIQTQICIFMLKRSKCIEIAVCGNVDVCVSIESRAQKLVLLLQTHHISKHAASF